MFSFYYSWLVYTRCQHHREGRFEEFHLENVVECSVLAAMTMTATTLKVCMQVKGFIELTIQYLGAD